MRELERQTGYQVVMGVNEAKLLETRRRVAHFQHCGIFRLLLLAVHEDRDLVFEKANDKDDGIVSRKSVRLQWEIDLEPRIAIQEAGTAYLEGGHDDGGEALREDAPAGFFDYDIRLDGQPNTRCRPELTISRPREPAASIAEIRFRVPLRLIAERRRVQVPSTVEKWKGQKVKLGDVRVDIGTASVSEGILLVEMFKSINNTDASRFEPLFQIADRDDRLIEAFSSGASQSRAHYAVHRSYRLPPVAGFRKEDLKLFVEEWTVVDVAPTFELRDIPLP
jgi:hypothetical protein